MGTVIYRVADGVATISLNRPARLNAINDALLVDLLAALQKANADDEVRCILLQGEGRAFCAGDDLKEFDVQTGGRSATTAYVEAIQAITRAMVLNDKIVVGSIHGWGVGGGLEWVINCDLAVVAEGSRFFFPEVALGVFVTGAVTALLPQIVGRERTKRLILLGERFDAREARVMGFDWQIVPEDRRETVAWETARRIAALPQGPVRQLKRIMAVAPYAGIDTAMGLETTATVEGFLDPQSAERVRRAIAGGGA